MAEVRTIQTAPISKAKLVDLTYAEAPNAANVEGTMRPRFMDATRQTIYATQWQYLHKSVDDGATYVQVKAPGGTERLQGAWQLPNGEVICTSKVAGSKGGLWLSTGFPASDTAATWTKVVTVTMKDNVIHGEWGLSFAPKGHPREGLVVATEYGGQGAAGMSDATDGARYAWLSLDYGKTWRQVFDLWAFTQKVSQHMHGCGYDPFDDRIFLTFGDGNTGNGAKSGIVLSDDFLAATPTWTYAYGPSTDATFQATKVMPLSTGILFGCDGMPPGVYRLPRRGYRSYGDMQVVLNYGGGTDTGFIGQQMYQAGAGQPILITHEWTKASGYAPALHITYNGVDFVEVWRDSIESNYSGLFAVGPTSTGKILGWSKLDSRFANGKTYITGKLQVD